MLGSSWKELEDSSTRH